jgi:hypothetical protein
MVALSAGAAAALVPEFVSELSWEELSCDWATEIQGRRANMVSAKASIAFVCRHTLDVRISDMGNPSWACRIDAAIELLVAVHVKVRQFQRLLGGPKGGAKEVVRDS